MTTTTPLTSTGTVRCACRSGHAALGRLGPAGLPAAHGAGRSGRAGRSSSRRTTSPSRRRSLPTRHCRTAAPRCSSCPRTAGASPGGTCSGRNLAQQGFHVLVVATRGTGGSGGEFRPFKDDVRDAPAVVAWLREQPWFEGRLASVGPSYLGYTQLALAMDPPPELRAMVLLAPAAQPGAAAWDHGAFRLQHALVVAAGIDSYHRGFAAFLRASARMALRLGGVARSQPLLDGYLSGTAGRRVPLFEDMLMAAPDDDRWAGTDLRAAITHPGPAAAARHRLVGPAARADPRPLRPCTGRRAPSAPAHRAVDTHVDGRPGRVARRAAGRSHLPPGGAGCRGAGAGRRRSRCRAAGPRARRRPRARAGATCRRGRPEPARSCGPCSPTASSDDRARCPRPVARPSSGTTLRTLRRRSAASCPPAAAPSTTPGSRPATTSSS